MITRIKLSNYRSLDSEVSVSLGPLTVLVGPNGSGKSNFVDALRFLSDCMRIGLEGAVTKRHGIGGVRRWSKGRPFNVSFDVSVETEKIRGQYSFVVASDKSGDYQVRSESASVTDREGLGSAHYEIERGKWTKGPTDIRPEVDPLGLAIQLLAGDKRFKPLADELRSITIYSIFPDTLRTPQRYNPSKPMDQHGSNWVSILKDQPESTWKPDLLAALNKLTGGDIIDMEQRRVSEFLVARFRHWTDEPPDAKKPRRKWFDSAQESDGTLRIAGILTALLQEPPLSLIGIEEPELTVHPGAIPLLMDHIREVGQRTQVVLTTHSPELLDIVEADEVRVVQKQNEATTIRRMNEGQREAVSRGLLTLGEVLRTEGIQQEQLFE